ncbi:MAG: hypothetical protein H8E55_74385 [Pelagibacterales bacterium]|jgi:uncharacterized protein (DUF983 family)|nr:hypothetical protein [Pelagibacterales bacterium]
MVNKQKIKFTTEVVRGLCPECEQNTVLVSFVPDFFRCTLCGNDLKQHINGKISYLPITVSSDKPPLL